MVVLLKTGRTSAEAWAAEFARLAPDIELRLWPDIGAPRDIDCLVTWDVPPGLLAQLPSLRLLYSVGAGADQFDLQAIPPDVQVVRTIEPGITNTMVEYVVMSVLYIHRDLFDYRAQQQREEWLARPSRTADSRTVGIMGLGVLGRAVLEGLRPFGFALHGWSRRQHAIDGVTTHAGQEALRGFLARLDIVICLLPLTAATRGLLDAALFDALPRGASLVHVGRGAQLDAAALLAALERGQLSSAVLDVTHPEPLPVGSPLWGHPRILLTPHIASTTQPATAAAEVIRNLRRHGRGEALHGLIDRSTGY